METFKIDLSRDFENLEIVTLADLHIGDPYCDIKYIEEKIDYIASNNNVYCILNGDIINNSIKQSVGDVYSEQMKPMDQLNLAIKLFEPIKDKILCVTSGNHELRTWKWDGIDLMGILCAQLGIKNYAKESALLFLRFGAESRNHKDITGERRCISYVIHVIHGSGGGRKEGAKANRLADMASIVDADVYIHSHTHLPMIMKQAFYRINISNSSVALVDKLFVNTSSYLNYGGYGEAFEFKPNSKDTPTIYLSGSKKRMEAKL